MTDIADKDIGLSNNGSKPRDSSSTIDTDSTNNNSSSNISFLRLKLSESLVRENIVEEFTLNNKGYLSLKLNHKSKKSVIVFQFQENYRILIKSFEERLNKQVKDIKIEHVHLLTNAIDENIDAILNYLGQQQGEKDEDKSRSSAKKALALAKESIVSIFIDEDSGLPYATVKVEDHIETLPVCGGRFRNWLCKLFYDVGNASILNSEAATNAINLLVAQAEFGSSRKKLSLRVGRNDDVGCSYSYHYDLTNPKWEVVKITAEHWSIEKGPGIFKRYSNQLPQVYPSRDYSPDICDRFMELTNVKDQDCQIILRCYIIALFFPEVPLPILMLPGEQGSGKTTLEELIKMLADPSSTRTLVFPRDINELVQQLDHNRITYYDNVSKIPDWISDQLCRAVTGSGFSKRRLYTDDDDITYHFMRAIGFNGINLAATNADLLDRGVIICLERIAKDRQKKIEDIWGEFEKLRPQLLAYILDIIVKVLQFKKNYGGIKLTEYPRMADFAELAEIISRCMGNRDNLFLEAYYRNIKLQTEAALESSFVAAAAIKFMEDKVEWKGSATDLLEGFEGIAAALKINTNNKFWPKSPNTLSRRLNEVKTNLREIGILIKRDKDLSGTKRIIIIRKISSGPSESSDQSHAQNESKNPDNTSEDADSLLSGESSGDNSENRGQNRSQDDTDDTDDIFPNPTGKSD